MVKECNELKFNNCAKVLINLAVDGELTNIDPKISEKF
jgi:hypothetical protein